MNRTKFTPSLLSVFVLSTLGCSLLPPTVDVLECQSQDERLGVVLRNPARAKEWIQDQEKVLGTIKDNPNVALTEAQLAAVVDQLDVLRRIHMCVEEAKK